jgi:hypothetical protein
MVHLARILKFDAPQHFYGKLNFKVDISKLSPKFKINIVLIYLKRQYLVNKLHTFLL